MKTRILCLLLVCASGSHCLAADSALTPAEAKQLEAVRAAALKEPEVKAASVKFNVARKAYQLDRAKFPAERSSEVAVAFRMATKELEEATRKAILAKNPSLASLLDKAQAKPTRRPLNEGETVADSDSTKNPAVRPIKDVPGLPRVLLIGDSISIGYTLPVRELLKGKANVHRIPVNGGATEVGLAKINDWLGDGRWDVIHFNFGLHDAKYMLETQQRATREQYERNLRTLIVRMKATGARLIFATTTPVPNGGVLSPTRKFDSIPERNALAVRLMGELGVAIDDLYAAVLPEQEKVGRPNDVHYSPEGYEVLAKAVAESIATQLPAGAPALFETDFRGASYGRTPDGWRDLIDRRPSRNWAVDGNSLLRPLLKNYTGLLVYDGLLATAKPARALTDGVVSAEFQKTEDERVAFGLVGRVQDQHNHYLARFRGDTFLELLKVQDGKLQVLASLATSRRYRDSERWRLTLTLHGDLLMAQLADAQGKEVARVDAKDGDFRRGSAGLCCTDYAAAATFRIAVLEPFEVVRSLGEIAKHNTRRRADVLDYPVVRPHWRTHELGTPPARLADDYDIVVAGAGTGGFAAAVQAARLGCRVLLLEETDWIGGQMCAAGVASMDEDGGWNKYPVRERGIYREFHESMVTYYRTLDKDPLVAYFSTPQAEGGYEPKTARAVLYGIIADARSRVVDGKKPTLDLSLRSRVTKVRKQGETVTGVTIEADTDEGQRQKEISCRVLIDATEYGDVIPLTGAPYRVGNVRSDKLDPEALVQDHTWTAVIREYPDGIPEHLKIKQAPPAYEEYAKRRYKNYQLQGLHIWGAEGKGIKGPRSWRVFFAWRGMADTESQLTGDASGLRHTQCGFNGGNDYPVSVATIEDPEQRRRDERFGIERTFGTLYYFQHELGLNWSLAEDEGYDTPYNRKKMSELGLRPDLEALAVHLPQLPYVREARRIVGVRTLVAGDLTRYENAKLFPTSVAMGDYFMDLDHAKTAHAVEPDLDTGEPPRGGGPFQVPFEVFLPEKLDGFLPAEKNLSQSRLANGATRLQPITMLTGQAVGVIAALAVQQGVPPRQLDVRQVQSVLLDAGCTLIQRWYADVPWGTPVWKATQLLSLNQVLDRPGPIDKDNTVSLAEKSRWGVAEPLTAAQLEAALARLAELKGQRRVSSAVPVREGASVANLKAVLAEIDPAWANLVGSNDVADPARLTAGEFALVGARVLLHPEGK